MNPQREPLTNAIIERMLTLAEGEKVGNLAVGDNLAWHRYRSFKENVQNPLFTLHR